MLVKTFTAEGFGGKDTTKKALRINALRKHFIKVINCAETPAELKTLIKKSLSALPVQRNLLGSRIDGDMDLIEFLQEAIDEAIRNDVVFHTTQSEENIFHAKVQNEEFSLFLAKAAAPATVVRWGRRAMKKEKYPSMTMTKLYAMSLVPTGTEGLERLLQEFASSNHIISAQEDVLMKALVELNPNMVKRQKFVSFDRTPVMGNILIEAANRLQLKPHKGHARNLLAWVEASGLAPRIRRMPEGIQALSILSSIA